MKLYAKLQTFASRSFSTVSHDGRRTDPACRKREIDITISRATADGRW